MTHNVDATVVFVAAVLALAVVVITAILADILLAVQQPML